MNRPAIRWSTLARIWLRQIAVLSLKEIRQLLRDRALFIYTVYIFTANIIIAAGGASNELRDSPVYVHDADRSVASRDLIYSFQPPRFRLAGEVESESAALRLLDRGEARMILDIPPDFAESLQRQRPAHVQALIDTSQANTGYLASSYAARIVARFSEQRVQRNIIRAGGDPRNLPTIRNDLRVWYNPDLNDKWFNTISELLTMVTVACILLPAAAMIREKERGTLEQLLVSPLTPLQIMLSKLLSMMLVMLCGTTVAVFGIMRPFYHVPFVGSVPLFYLLAALYAFTNAGLGLVAATFARNSAQVGLVVLLMVMPIVMLSGTWTPMESMPAWLRTLMYLSPLSHFIEVAYGILLRGAGIGVLWESVAAMAAIGIALFALGLARFRTQFV
ncbi:MAG: ABC transporter permease [Burkholderiales bacterium]|jgi:ABC-2 type transport system permease protein